MPVGVETSCVSRLNILAFILHRPCRFRPISRGAWPRRIGADTSPSPELRFLLARDPCAPRLAHVLQCSRQVARPPVSVFIRHGRCCGPTIGSGLIISWAGMRGIVSLAAALALPSAFPYRDLIVLTRFSVVLGTLRAPRTDAQPLFRALDFAMTMYTVGRELSAARELRLSCGACELRRDRSRSRTSSCRSSRHVLGYERADADAGDATRSAHSELLRGALQAARQSRSRHACQ